MQRVEGITNLSKHGPLASDVQKLIRIVGRWADERPLLLDAALFGDRLLHGHNEQHPVNIAVRFDETRMVEGFDDWIEQLRTGFAELASTLGEPVCITTPDMGTRWRSVVFGTELFALATGKVRIIAAAAEPPAPPVKSSASRRRTSWSLSATEWGHLVADIRWRRPAL